MNWDISKGTLDELVSMARLNTSFGYDNEDGKRHSKECYSIIMVFNIDTDKNPILREEIRIRILELADLIRKEGKL